MDSFGLETTTFLQKAYPYLVGFLISTLFGHLAINLIVGLMWKLIEKDVVAYLKAEGIKESKAKKLIDRSRLLKRYGSQPAIVGLLERFLYLGSLLIQRPEFIAVWLGIKTVVESNRWKGSSSNTETMRSSKLVKAQRKIRPLIPGRAIYNTFLIGNALSLTFALIGYFSIVFLVNEEIALATGGVFLSLLVVLGAYILVAMDIRRNNKEM